MAELLRGRPAPKAEWMVSVSLDLLTTTSFSTLVHEFEGLGSWLLETHTALDPALRHDLDLALRLTNYAQAVIETVAVEVVDADSATHADAAALFDGLGALDAPTCQRMIEDVLAKSMRRHEIATDQTAAEILADPAALADVLERLRPPVPLAEAAALLRDPTAWRDLIRASLHQFWNDVYRERWNATHDQLMRNVEYHRHQHYASDLAALFTAVTGRQIPDGARARIDQIELLRFVPSLYIGPYVSFLYNPPHATVFYNGESTPATDNAPGPQLEDVYHPLTALADKTRLAIVAMLNGRELYAQEIVDRLGISQSAVSRHLQLMVDMKVLNVRRGERGAKFYSINSSALQHVSQRLSELK